MLARRQGALTAEEKDLVMRWWGKRSKDAGDHAQRRKDFPRGGGFCWGVEPQDQGSLTVGYEVVASGITVSIELKWHADFKSGGESRGGVRSVKLRAEGALEEEHQETILWERGQEGTDVYCIRADST